MQKTTVAWMATTGCLGLSLLFIASAIVLSLLPIYLQDNTVATNPGLSYFSSNFQIYLFETFRFIKK
jgi:hypothetical protein